MSVLAVGTPCPINERPSGPIACRRCKFFAGYRDEKVSCLYRTEDPISWLKREMRPAAPAPIATDKVLLAAIGVVGFVVGAILAGGDR